MRCRHALTALAALAALAGCTTAEAPASCPEVLILGDAERITKFAEGRGGEVADVEAEAALVGFKGQCRKVEGGLEVALKVALEAQRGPADRDGVVDLAYFVAVPDFYPSPRAKSVFPVRLTFPSNASRMSLVDDEVVMRIPLDPGASAATHPIYIGFQLSAEQLDLNRQRR